MNNMNKTERKTMLNPPSNEYPSDEYGDNLSKSFQWCVENIGQVQERTSKTFFKNYIKAVEESGISPKKFAKNNKINFKNIFDLYYDRFICPDNTQYGGNDSVIAFEDWIIAGSGIVKLCDFFGIKIKTQEFFQNLDKSSNGLYSFRMEEEDPEYFKKAVLNSSKEDCMNFARLFSSKPEKWFEKEQHWLRNFKA